MLADTALTEQEKASSLLLLSSYILSEVRLSRDLRFAQEQIESATGATPSFGQMITQLIETGRYPALAKALVAGVFDDAADAGIETETEFGLQRILDGIEILMTKRHERAE